MNPRPASPASPVIAVKPVAGRPASLPTAAQRWHAGHLLLAPHRLGFFLAMAVLVASAAWWALVQLARAGVLPAALAGVAGGVAPTLVHAAVMVLGFMPLFFAGFLFTAGPKWLGVEPPAVRAVAAPLLLMAGGWLLWLVAARAGAAWALAGLAVAGAGLAWVTALFARLVQRSRAPDRVHARVIAVACMVGCASVAGLGWGVAAGDFAMARAWVFTALWGFVVPVYVAVAHRMIPFFTSSALPMVAIWRPFWVLWLMLAAAALQWLAVWVDFAGPLPGALASGWTLLRGTLELAAGGTLLWLAREWGLVQSFKNRLLAMLHVGFLWLGVAFVLGGAAQWAGWLRGTPVLAWGVLHALSMGCLASLMLAMVTRVSCGHSGGPLVADGALWSLFWLLQVATVLRIVADVPAWSGWIASALLPLAAVLWLVVMAAWGSRLASWYGRLRADGRPG